MSSMLDLELDMEFPEWWEDEVLTLALEYDDKEMFIKAIDNKLDDMLRSSSGSSIPQKFLYRVLCYGSKSIKCAEALIRGQTRLKVDINLPCTDTGAYPIHVVSMGHYGPAIIELLLHYGARTDMPFPDYFSQLLPLQALIIRLFSDSKYKTEWTPKQPTSKFLRFLLPLCLPLNQDRLESIALLAGKTEETDKIFLKYAKEGDVIGFAVLLTAAHEKVYGIMDRIRGHFDSVGDEENDNVREAVLCISQLIEVFDRAGDEISAYVKQDRCSVSCINTCADVLRLLQRAGFDVLPWTPDVLVNFIHSLGPPAFSRAVPYGHRCLSDFGMAHYSKSGYRWKVSINDPALEFFNSQAYMNELQKEIDRVKEENVNIILQQQKPKLAIWMDDDELESALDKDSKDDFLLVINSKVDLFRSRQQQLLYAVCEAGAIKCAEALVKAETLLTLDLNLPCNDTGMYPLHYAALSLLPSFTELFIYNGALTNVQYKLSDSFPQHHLLKEVHGKLPLHMALLAISHLPCIREWNPEQSIIKLFTLFCLPRMNGSHENWYTKKFSTLLKQNAMETLALLVNTTKGVIRDEFLQFAMEGKIMELAALVMVAKDDLYDYMSDKIRELDISNVLSYDRKDKLRVLANVIKGIRPLSEYLQENKYNVSKDQVSEDVWHLLLSEESDGIPLSSLNTDLSVYNWYRNEELSYPSTAPYENTRLLHDVGMEHFCKSPHRWDVDPLSDSDMTEDNKEELEEELEVLKEESDIAKEQLKRDLKHEIFSILLSSSRQNSQDAVNKDGSGNSHSSFPTRTMALTASSFYSYKPSNLSSRTMVLMTTEPMVPSLGIRTGRGKTKTCIGLYKHRQRGFGVKAFRTPVASISNHRFCFGTFHLEGQPYPWHGF